VRIIQTRKFETPVVVEAAEARQRTYEARLENRPATGHQEPIENHPHGGVHTFKSVPPNGYFTRRAISKQIIELCYSDRNGKQIGIPCRCRLEHYDRILRVRRIYPVVVKQLGSVTLHHLPIEQWRALRSIITKPKSVEDGPQPVRRPQKHDPLKGLHGQKFHSLSELKR